MNNPIYENHVLFYQDIAQRNKIINHSFLRFNYFVYYNGRRVISVYKQNNKNFSEKSSILKLSIDSILKKSVVVCEFSNLVPRLFALLTFSAIESHIFGYVNENTLKCVLAYPYFPKILKRLFCNQYSSKYIVYGRFNPTINVCNKLINAGIEVIFRPRTDLINLRNRILKKNDFIVYVGQSWDALGKSGHQLLENKITKYLSDNFSFIYCRHPRSKFSNAYKDELLGYDELLNFLIISGTPRLVVSLSSSLIYELKELGVTSEALLGATATEELEFDEIKVFENLNKLLNDHKA
jgi:hypothetical protein